MSNAIWKCSECGGENLVGQVLFHLNNGEVLDNYGGEGFDCADCLADDCAILKPTVHPYAFACLAHAVALHAGFLAWLRLNPFYAIHFALGDTVKNRRRYTDGLSIFAGMLGPRTVEKISNQVRTAFSCSR